MDLLRDSFFEPLLNEQSNNQQQKKVEVQPINGMYRPRTFESMIRWDSDFRTGIL